MLFSWWNIISPWNVHSICFEFKPAELFQARTRGGWKKKICLRPGVGVCVKILGKEVHTHPKVIGINTYDPRAGRALCCRWADWHLICAGPAQVSFSPPLSGEKKKRAKRFFFGRRRSPVGGGALGGGSRRRPGRSPLLSSDLLFDRYFEAAHLQRERLL